MKPLREIAEVVEVHGLGEALTEGYLHPEDFEDPELATCADKARDCMTSISNAVEPYFYE